MSMLPGSSRLTGIGPGVAVTSYALRPRRVQRDARGLSRGDHEPADDVSVRRAQRHDVLRTERGEPELQPSRAVVSTVGDDFDGAFVGDEPLPVVAADLFEL